MSLLEQVFSLSKEEQLALLDELEKKATTSSPIVLPKEVIDTFELPPEVNIEEELAKIKEIVLAEVQSITINAPKGDKGEKGPKGDKGDVGPQGKDGKDGKQGKDGKDGVDGKDGISVTDAHVDFDGSLVITLSNGKEINAGDVVPNDKKDLVIQSLKNGALTLLELGIVEYLASPPPIGSTTPNTGKFTSVTTPSVTATTSDLSLNVTGSGAIKHNLSNSVTWYMASPASSVARLMAGGQSVLEARISVPNWMRFQTNSSADFLQEGYEQFRVANTTSAVNYINVTGSTTGNQTVISALGSDANIPLALSAKGSGTINLYQTTAIGRGSTNWMSVNGSTASGYAVQTNIFGADTNVSMAFQPKGTGAIDLAAGSSGVNISNGGTVTALTRTNVGAGYTSIPSIAISAPTTAGGTTATATVTSMGINFVTVVSGGIGYAVNDEILISGGTFTTQARYRITAVSGGVVTTLTPITTPNYQTLPANPASTTTAIGTGSGLTLTVNWAVTGQSITNAGSGYIEQPTVTFSGGGASSQATAYATVGSGTIVKALGNNINFNTPNSQVLSIVDKNSGGNYPTNTNPAFTMVPSQNAFGASYLGMLTGGYFATNNTGSGAFVFATGISPPLNGNGGSAQLQVSHTASAVNYLQATGGATGNTPILSAQGSDATIGLRLQSKGTSFLYLQNNLGTTQFSAGGTSSAVNYLNARGNATGSGAALEASGTDTNIAMQMVTKGTGAFDIAAGSSGVNISNGNTVTGIVVSSGGGGYTSVPALTISAPTSSGGVQAVGQVRVGLWGQNVASGGTGYTVGDILTYVGGTPYLAVPPTQAIVTSVSGGVITGLGVYNNQYGTYTTTPTNPISVTGGTGTGATINATWTVYGVAVTTAGSGYVEQPTLSFPAPPSGTTATAYAYVGNNTQIKGLGSYQSFYSPIGETLRVFGDSAGTANGYVGLISSSTSSNGSHVYTSAGSLYVSCQNTGAITFFTNGAGSTAQARVAHTASAVNWIQFTGATTGSGPIISAQGSDTNITPQFRSKGTGDIAFANSSGQWGFYVTPIANTSNQIKVVSAVAGGTPFFQSTGSDTNISLNLITKGTGTVQQNGNPLAQVNHKYHAFNVGTYYYDTYEQTNFFRLFTQNATADTIRYGTVTSPEYYDYGTSTWTAWAAGQTGIQNLLDGNPSTGMDVAHANRTFRFIVNASDGWPTNALVMLQTTWSAVTYTTATVTIASSSTVGGTYTTRQVMTFSSANTGNNWGMHAYYTNAIHTGDTFYRITIDLTDWVDNTTYTTYPLRNLCIFSNYSAVPGRQNPFSTSFDKRTTFIGGISTVDDVNGSLYVGRYSSADPSTYIDAGSSATRMNLRTQYTTQLQLFHTVSAVNYLQVSGGSTGNGVTLAAVGSDTNINTFITSKNASSIVMQTNGRENFRVADGGTSVVNNLQAVGSTTGFGAILQARGSDTNVDITFTPKGTGVVQFGTHTATADVAITGYITIKDSSGTLRKLAVIT